MRPEQGSGKGQDKVKNCALYASALAVAEPGGSVCCCCCCWFPTSSTKAIVSSVKQVVNLTPTRWICWRVEHTFGYPSSLLSGAKKDQAVCLSPSRPQLCIFLRTSPNLLHRNISAAVCEELYPVAAPLMVTDYTAVAQRQQHNT